MRCLAIILLVTLSWRESNGHFLNMKRGVSLSRPLLSPPSLPPLGFTGRLPTLQLPAAARATATSFAGGGGGGGAGVPAQTAASSTAQVGSASLPVRTSLSPPSSLALSTLSQRTLTGLLLALIWTPLCFAGKPLFSLALLGPLLLAVREFQNLLQHTPGLSSDGGVGVSVGVASTLLACVLATYAPDLHHFVVPVSTVALVLQALFARATLISSGALTAAAFSHIYIPYFMSFWIRLLDTSAVRFSRVPAAGVRLGGRLPLASLVVSDAALLLWGSFFVIAAADIGGFVVGRALGRARRGGGGGRGRGGLAGARWAVAARQASPRKTLEGLLGSVLFAAASAVLGGALAGPVLLRPWRGAESATTPLGYKFCILYGGVLALLSFASDVSVSLFKRNAGAKDAGRVLPGHGGVLDRMDSYLLTGPVVFMFWALVARQGVT